VFLVMAHNRFSERLIGLRAADGRALSRFVLGCHSVE
jgi:hypothetical protein